MNQIAVLPLVSRQRMSPLPSALKSPCPTTDQTVDIFPSPPLWTTAWPFENCATPQVAQSAAPFKTPIAVLPRVSRHSKWAVPSRLKPRGPTIDQEGGTFPSPPDEVPAAPFMIHTAALPL